MPDILLDTNILRRVMENKLLVVREIEELAINNQFLVSDLTLFEIFDFLERNPKEQQIKFFLLKDFLSKHNIQLIYRKESQAFNDCKNNITISTAKNLLFDVFQKRMVEMCVNIIGTYFIALANSLDSSFNSEFYDYIRNLYQTDFSPKVEAVISGIIKDCYQVGSQKKFEKEFEKCTIDLMLGELTYFELSKKPSYTEEEYNATLEKNRKKYTGKKAREILQMHISNNTVFDMIDNSKNNKYTNIFLCNYTKDLIFKNRQFKINDMVDTLNFITCIKENILYLSLDRDSFKKYQRYYSNDKTILDLIDKSQSLSEPILKLL